MTAVQPKKLTNTGLLPKSDSSAKMLHRRPQLVVVCITFSKFDAHHHVCHEGLSSYEDQSVTDMFYAARETWSNSDWQLVHISNGQTAFTDRQHSDLITGMPSVYQEAPWIKIEAKAKEQAITRLQAKWLLADWNGNLGR